ncbi:fructokinase [Pseudorhodobacter antarcticus]|jgi:fructokinase|uniref:Fructokinase n=1 Tax=Pseudorhodobacter antarcticus TaxID=1077947 RepID=A0A1H8F8V3_9RHOB|nr:nucleoside/nucleotide kinase family protein [Pseudorhodobacter antarcticus]SEN28040.1 fructokinase [Pseudorhodobacter antarcticus]
MKAALDLIAARRGSGRLIVAIVGAPGSGKSTLAEGLAAQIAGAVVVPMDGFHLDNAVLMERGLLDRKGAPDTYDVAGFAALLGRLRVEQEVVIPLFDRTRDVAVAGAAVIGPDAEVLLVEGNYLLLEHGPWASLRPFWDVTIALDVPLAVLEARLVQRWRDHGLAADAAQARAMGNDIPNARLVIAGSVPADMVIQQG